MKIKRGFRYGDDGFKEVAEFKCYSKEELLHKNAVSIINENKQYTYCYTNGYWDISESDLLKIKSNLICKALMEFLPKEKAERATELIRKLALTEIVNHKLTCSQEADRNLDLALADMELEQILENTPISIIWKSPSLEYEEIMFKINKCIYCVIGFLPEEYFMQSNFHTINKDNYDLGTNAI